jgi:hypothetical protein
MPVGRRRFASERSTLRHMSGVEATKRKRGAGNDSTISPRCPREDSNLRPWFRRPVLYPLSYGGRLNHRSNPCVRSAQLAKYRPV